MTSRSVGNLEPPAGADEIDARPTKALFISMLVKDISLIDAIVDLADNSVDGARRLRPVGDYDGLWIRVEADQHHFKISDNCGGIDIDIARHYAFRFGRLSDQPPTPHSIGQFGVGMKRALFKLGNWFSVESTTTHTHFVVEVDVDEWVKHDKWVFEFTKLDEHLSKQTQDKQGTSIVVRALHPSVSEALGLENTMSRLARALEQRQIANLERKLTITLNGIPAQARPLELLQSANLKPGYREWEFPPGNPRLRARIFAGISESEPRAAGWYVFCNGRLVLDADKTDITGWGEGTVPGWSEGGIPGFHNQYARFRGFVFFDSDDASLLPWNTTKTAIDADSPLYKSVRQQMIILMQPVMSFLNRMKEERERYGEGKGSLAAQVRTAQMASVMAITDAPTVFVAPRPREVSEGPKMGAISYHKPIEEIEKAKRSLSVRKNSQVGERTFDYYMQLEGEENG